MMVIIILKECSYCQLWELLRYFFEDKLLVLGLNMQSIFIVSIVLLILVLTPLGITETMQVGIRVGKTPPYAF